MTCIGFRCTNGQTGNFWLGSLRGFFTYKIKRFALQLFGLLKIII